MNSSSNTDAEFSSSSSSGDFDEFLQEFDPALGIQPYQFDPQFSSLFLAQFRDLSNLDLRLLIISSLLVAGSLAMFCGRLTLLVSAATLLSLHRLRTIVCISFKKT